MKSIASTIEKTLKLQIDQYASVRECGFGSTLSPFLCGAFDTYVVEVAGKHFCVAKPREKDSADVGVVKTAAALEDAIGMPIVLYFADMPPALKRLLIKERRGFVSATGDLYLPHMALSLTAPSFGAAILRGNFTPGEQSLFLYCLYCDKDRITQAGAMDTLEISSATASRALSALVDRDLIDYEVGGFTGRLKEYFIPDKKAFYRDGIAQFGSPIHSSMMASFKKGDQQLLFSGLSALSALSDLTKPRPEVLAASRTEAKDLRDYETHHIDDERRYLVQILKYDPQPLARIVWNNLNCVDPVTMLLTLNDSDERISMAIREVMGRFEWYTE